MEQKIKRLQQEIRRQKERLTSAPPELQIRIREIIESKLLELKMLRYNMDKMNDGNLNKPGSVTPPWPDDLQHPSVN